MVRRVFWLSLLGVIACGDGDPNDQRLCDGETRGDTYVDGLSKGSTAGTYQLALESTQVEGQPKAPDRGMNVWSLRLADPAGAPVGDAQLVLRSWMPDHGHGTSPNNLSATPQDQGRYQVGPFDIFMGGLWEFTFTIGRGGSKDTAKFAFCVEG